MMWTLTRRALASPRRSSPSNYNDVKLKLLQEGGLEFRDADMLYPADPTAQVVSYAAGPLQPLPPHEDVYGSTQLGAIMDLQQQQQPQHVQASQVQDHEPKKKKRNPGLPFRGRKAKEEGTGVSPCRGCGSPPEGSSPNTRANAVRVGAAVGKQHIKHVRFGKRPKSSVLTGLYFHHVVTGTQKIRGYTNGRAQESVHQHSRRRANREMGGEQTRSAWSTWGPPRSFNLAEPGAKRRQPYLERPEIGEGVRKRRQRTAGAATAAMPT
ncbi:hypothetical protein MRX96_013292 [Rhipicephalus microplus]